MLGAAFVRKRIGPEGCARGDPGWNATKAYASRIACGSGCWMKGGFEWERELQGSGHVRIGYVGICVYTDL